ncbi:MAG: thrombospondin type 3 repeat-containing protein [Paludibacter sp.]|nr:thrombospondin type 3 repeat-containing protein [Bacteroidales bacterium]MCM1068405.1 thrombospondin type 3 repeat-containing protein [Prevotella sp.]MCM1353360.1 thrombospondin type 3 repeat-containing protein [Bacteroides sp.]MCM1442521.1 thrombospondin type 3 repeat-containing protein [Muribaculum sp.]MCM1481366.1 thrombospondin type 3 repeat-containing protein [Paludibacter sp.]
MHNKGFLSGIVFIIASATLWSQTLAFPEAEGFGRYAQGGRGGKVVTVSNLQDYTSQETPIEGSLRWALEQYVHQEMHSQILPSAIDGSDSAVQRTITVYEPLTIVFNVAGNIELKEDLKVKRDYLTIAGQTAPGDGICITGHSMLFNGATGGEMWYWGPRRKHLIVRYMRFRPSTPTAENKFITYGTDVENYEYVIFDHCTMTWANEECLAIYDNKYTTVQWCIVAEGLYNAYHPKGTRSYCGVWGGQFATYHHNLIAHNNSRNIRFNGARAHDTIAVVEYRNNIVYNWGPNNSGYGLEFDICTPVSRNELNMVNNYYQHGPASGNTDSKVSPGNKVNRLVRIDQSKASVDNGYLSQHYITGNYLTYYDTVSADNWFCGVQYSAFSDTAQAKQLFRAEMFSPEVEMGLPAHLESAAESYERVLAEAGACAPRRDSQDARIVNETRTGTAIGMGSLNKSGIIDNPMAVGGWPSLSGIPYTDSDEDGIPDEWEITHGLDPTNPNDGALLTDSGYSNLEIYINSIEQITTHVNFIQTQRNGIVVRINGLLYIKQGEQYFDLTGKAIK